MRYVVLGLAVLAACNSTVKLDRSADESPPERTLQAPLDSIPGELGGPCGVDYVNCPTSESLVNKFRGLNKRRFRVTPTRIDQRADRVV
jgi:hypothetical protein